MMRSRSRFGRFIDNMRRNVFSYKYIRHNILMTAIVVAMALVVFAVVSFGETSDPLADELYANESVTVSQSQAVMMEEDSVKLAMDAVSPVGSYVSANDSVNVASSQNGSSDADTQDESAVDTSMSGTVLYDGVCVQAGQSADSEVLSMLNSGDVVGILAQDESWVRVKLDDGTTGYVGTEFLSIQ